MYEEKVHGHSQAGELLTGNMDFFTITTQVNILPSDTPGGSAMSQRALDKLVEVISLRGQPIILGQPVRIVDDFIFKFATEHTGAWAGATPNLTDSVAQHGTDFGFTADNLAVVSADKI